MEHKDWWPFIDSSPGSWDHFQSGTGTFSHHDLGGGGGANGSW